MEIYMNLNGFQWISIDFNGFQWDDRKSRSHKAP